LIIVPCVTHWICGEFSSTGSYLVYGLQFTKAITQNPNSTTLPGASIPTVQECDATTDKTKNYSLAHKNN